MTKETKIGLLVGLAFIVLFAIILSEKGTAHRDTKAPMFSMADQAKSSSNMPSAQPLEGMGHLPIEGILNPIVQPGPALAKAAPLNEEEPVQGTARREEEPLDPLPQNLVDSLNLPKVAEVPDEGSTEEPVVTLAPPSSGTTAHTRTEGPDASESKLASLSKPQTSGRDSLSLSSSRTEGAAKETGQPSKEKLERIRDEVGIRVRTIHKVQQGESIGKIAAKYYGRSNPDRVEAIFKANRDVLKTPASVKAGTSLKIPDLGEGFEPAPDFVLGNSTKTPVVGKPMPEKTTPAFATMTSPRDDQPHIPVPIHEKTGAPSLSPSRASTTPDAASHSPSHESSTRLAKSPLGFRWYEVRKSDTLSKIARRELGGEKHLTTLYEMNQDILKNRNSLKPGTKIRLPAKVTGSTELSTVQSARGNGDGEP